MKKLYNTFILVLMILLISFGSVPTLAETAAADNTDTEQTEIGELSEELKELQQICDQLPAANKVDEEDGDLIISAKKLYNAIDRSERAKLGSENLQKLSDVYNAYLPFMIGGIVEKVEELPENPKEKDKDSIVEIYDLYNLLTDSEKEESFEEDFIEKLLKAVNAVAPDLLSEEETEVLAKAEQEETTDEKSEKAAVFGISIINFVALVVAALVIIFNLILIVFISIKIFKTANK